MSIFRNTSNFFMNLQNSIYSKVEFLDGVPLLALRLFLAPIMIIAGWTKFENLSGTTQFFSSIGIPLAEIMTPLAAATELVGGILILVGLATRLIAIPLAVTMIVAALSVHLGNGWFAIAQTDANRSPARVVALTHLPMAIESQKNARVNAERVKEMRKHVDRHSRSKWIKEGGRPALLQNGIEYAITYLIMLLVLCFYGGGRYVSADYFICKSVKRR